jgi:hypothetical protein
MLPAWCTLKRKLQRTLFLVVGTRVIMAISLISIEKLVGGDSDYVGHKENKYQNGPLICILYKCIPITHFISNSCRLLYSVLTTD